MLMMIRVGTAHGSGDIMSSTVVTETDVNIDNKLFLYSKIIKTNCIISASFNF